MSEDVWTPKDAFERSPEAEQMLERAMLSRDLVAGTAAMRSRGDHYLPAFPKEIKDDWERRKDRTFLDPIYGEALEDFTGRVFEEPPVVSEDLSPVVAAWLDNIDGSGADLQTFASRAFWTGLRDGLVHALADLEALSDVISVAEAEEMGVRPRAILLPIDRLLGWRWQWQDGEVRVTQIRFLDERTEGEGRFGRRIVRRAIVMEPGFFEVWRQDADGEAVPETEGTFDLDYIPLRTFYAGKSDQPLMAWPFLSAVTWKMLELWQQSSDQSHALSYARRLIWHFSGFSKDEFNAIDSLGSNLKIRSDNKEAVVNVVEPSGSGIQHGQAAIDELKSSIKERVRKPLVGQTPGTLTATEAALRTSVMQASIRELALRCEHFLDGVVVDMAAYREIDVEDAVTIHRDFRFGGESQDMPTIQSLIDAGESKTEQQRRVLLEEAKRRDLVMNTWTVEDLWPEPEEPEPEPETEPEEPEETEPPSEMEGEEPPVEPAEDGDE